MRNISEGSVKGSKTTRWTAYLCLLGLTFSSCVDLSKPQEDGQGTTSTTTETGQAATSEQTGQSGTPAAGDDEASTDESVNLTDFEGTYEGTIPCEDCEGIRTKITINNNETFNIHTERLGTGKTVADNGRYKLEENGGILHLKAKDTDLKLKIAENKLLHLDKNDQVVEGKEANQYVYQKVNK